MSPHTRADDGFGLIEAIIAIMLLAAVAVALAPALINGLLYSSEQAVVATATRQLNALVEQARELAKDNEDCSIVLGSVTGSHPTIDGLGREISITGDVVGPSCVRGGAVTVNLIAEQNGRTLATADATIAILPLPVTSP